MNPAAPEFFPSEAWLSPHIVSNASISDLRYRLYELRRLEDHAARVVQRSWRSFQQRRYLQASKKNKDSNKAASRSASKRRRSRRRTRPSQEEAWWDTDTHEYWQSWKAWEGSYERKPQAQWVPKELTERQGHQRWPQKREDSGWSKVDPLGPSRGVVYKEDEDDVSHEVLAQWPKATGSRAVWRKKSVPPIGSSERCPFAACTAGADAGPIGSRQVKEKEETKVTLQTFEVRGAVSYYPLPRRHSTRQRSREKRSVSAKRTEAKTAWPWPSYQ